MLSRRCRSAQRSVYARGTDADRAMLKKIVNEVMIPKWAARCSAECVKGFNDTIGKVMGVVAKK